MVLIAVVNVVVLPFALSTIAPWLLLIAVTIVFLLVLSFPTIVFLFVLSLLTMLLLAVVSAPVIVVRRNT